MMGALLLAMTMGVPRGTCELAGRVRFVESEAAADFVVRFVDGPADLRVQFVDAAPHRGGQWLEVGPGEPCDFAVLVAGPGEPYDFAAREVDRWPGC